MDGRESAQASRLRSRRNGAVFMAATLDLGLVWLEGFDAVHASRMRQCESPVRRRHGLNPRFTGEEVLESCSE